jgi:predicted NBD/HSP70 family sugar kinase
MVITLLKMTQETTTIGVDLGGAKLLVVAGEKQLRLQTGVSFSSVDLEHHLRAFIQNLDALPSGIGIAIPGLVDDTGCIQACDVLPGMVGWNPVEALADVGCPIKAVNDVSAALAEEFHDAPATLTGGVIMVGTAVGAAFLIDGLPLLGASGWAGELGYIPISINDEVKRLDELAGGAFIAGRLDLKAQTLVERAQSDDESVLLAVREGGYALGLAIATVINLFNPSRIALGGGTLELKGYEESAYRAAQQFSLPELWRSCSLTKVKAGDTVVALGAMRLASAL